MKFPVFLIPILWDVKERRAADRRRPEHTTVNTSKLVFPLLFRTAARHSSGDIEELHAGQRHTLSGVWSVPLLGFKPQGVCSVRPHYSVCAPAGIQTPVFNCPSGNTVTTLTELPDTPCSYRDGTVDVSEGEPSGSIIFRPEVRWQRRQKTINREKCMRRDSETPHIAGGADKIKASRNQQLVLR